MIYGLFLDPRTWKIDITSSQFWNTEKYGVRIDLHHNAFNIPKIGIDSKYKFVICSEVWEIPMRKTLHYLRNKGLKVFLLAREPFKTKILRDAMFSYEHFRYKNKYYFTPDVVLAAGQAYADLWKDKTKTIVTGYPRFDYYANSSIWPSKDQVSKKHNLDVTKKWIFFPSYPPFHYKKKNGKDIMVDLFDARESTLQYLEEFAKRNSDYQVVVKIHPASMKPFKKNIGRGNEVSGTLLERYNNPTKAMRVIGDIRNSGLESKEILINSHVVCGFISTMLLEASIINKPAIHLLIGDSVNLKGIPEYADYIPVANDKSSLWSLLHLSQLKKFPNSNKMVKKYLYKIDGKACERICNAIKKELKDT